MDLPVSPRVVRSTMTVMSMPSVYLTPGIPTGTPVAVTKDTEGTGNGVNKKVGVTRGKHIVIKDCYFLLLCTYDTVYVSIETCY